MFFHRGRVRRDSLDDRALMALNISMTTRIDNETVEADLAMSLENIAQPISGYSAEQWWKRVSWRKVIWGPSVLYMNHQAYPATVARPTRVERQSGGRKTIGDKVYPKKLNRNQGFRHAKSSREEDGNNLANVGGDEITDELLSVVVDGASLLNSDLDSGKVAVGEDHVGGQLGDIGSRTHGNTDISLLQSRSVVDTITSHGNNFAKRLKEIDQSGLVAGLNTGEQRGTLGCFELLVGRQLIKFAASVALSSKILVLAKDTNLSADALSSVAVVASDNNNTDTSVLALLNSMRDLLTRRVKHANKSEESHLLFKLGVVLGGISGLEKRVLGHVVNAGEGDNSETVVAGDLLAIGANKGLCAAINDRLGSTLDQELLVASTANQDGHALAITGEFVCGETGKFLLVGSAGIMNTIFGAGIGGSARSNLLDENSKSALGGFTDAGKGGRLGIVGKLSVVADGGDLGHLPNCVGRDMKVPNDDTAGLDRSTRSESSALNIKLAKLATVFVQVHNLVHTHLVGGQGTSLVRANDTAASKSLDRGEASDHSVLRGHLSRSKSQTGGNNNSQTLGDSSDTKRDGNLQVVDGTLGPVTVTRVVEVGDINEPDQDADDSNDLGQFVTEIVKLLLQGGRLRDLSSDALVNISDGGVGTSEDDDGSSATSNHCCSREQHVGLVL
ncbi:hypothetical protein HG531_013390 [Fusarium graminearum]|nr:hypothetical protein HG531_013390 [Fusarium graminearum]